MNITTDTGTCLVEVTARERDDVNGRWNLGTNKEGIVGRSQQRGIGPYKTNVWVRGRWSGQGRRRVGRGEVFMERKGMCGKLDELGGTG